MNDEATVHMVDPHAPGNRPDPSEFRDGQAPPDAESALGDVAGKRLRRVSGASLGASGARPKKKRDRSDRNGGGDD
jgi:hypothetical protein